MVFSSHFLHYFLFLYFFSYQIIDCFSHSFNFFPCFTSLHTFYITFLWMACRNVHPTRINLQIRGVQCEGICVMCEENLENAWHVLIDCNYARQCWVEAGLWHLIDSIIVGVENLPELIFEFMVCWLWICSFEGANIVGMFRVALLQLASFAFKKIKFLTVLEDHSSIICDGSLEYMEG